MGVSRVDDTPITKYMTGTEIFQRQTTKSKEDILFEKQMEENRTRIGKEFYKIVKDILRYALTEPLKIHTWTKSAQDNFARGIT